MNKEYPHILITQEMIDAAKSVEGEVTVNRTKCSKNDTLVGIIGEYVFAQYYLGDWKQNTVGSNKGKIDFGDIEIKTSAFPFSERLNLLVREDYALKRQPKYYVQLIIDTPVKGDCDIEAGMKVYICGYATHGELISADKRDFGNKSGYGKGGYSCFFIPVTKLQEFKAGDLV
jgi:hypothetical protein